MSSTSDSYPQTGSSSEQELSDDSVEFMYTVIKQYKAIQDTATSSRGYVRRDRNEAEEMLMRDYFSENPTYSDATFRETFRLPKKLFLEIVERIKASGNPYFQEGYDARSQKSFTAIQKCLSAVQQLADGGVAAQNDKYYKMAGRTARECLQEFCDAVNDLYSREFFRKPTAHDIATLQKAHEELHHIPGMIGSIDCTHFEWRMCPRRLQGQYKRGCYKHPTIMLEAVTSWDLWFWHGYFGPPGTNNDINVLNTSPLFLRERNQTAPPSSFAVNGRNYKRGYYLADGGYPSWSVFVKAYKFPVDPKEVKFKRLQEAARKDVERAFGVLKCRWGILNRPLRPKMKARISKIVYTCIILHNMLIKEDGHAISPVHIIDQPIEPQFDEDALMELRDEEVNSRLRFDLTEHVWPQYLDYLDAQEP